MSKIKASENTAETVERKPNTIETMTTEQLALTLNQQWVQFNQIQNNIQIINQEIQKREQSAKKG